MRCPGPTLASAYYKYTTSIHTTTLYKEMHRTNALFSHPLSIHLFQTSNRHELKLHRQIYYSSASMILIFHHFHLPSFLFSLHFHIHTCILQQWTSNRIFSMINAASYGSYLIQ